MDSSLAHTKLFSVAPLISPALMEEYLHTKFVETRVIAIALSLFAALSVIIRWSWDYVIDPVHAPQTILLRLLMGLILLIHPLCILAGVRPSYLSMVLYASLLLCQVLFFLILSRLAQGVEQGVGGFLYSFSGAALAIFSYRFKVNLLGGLALVCFPNILALLGMAQGFSFTHYNALFLPVCVAFIFLAFIFDRVYQRIFLLQRKIKELAIKDHLTKLNNRYHFMEQSQVLLLAAQRYNHPLSLLVLDIDHFKLVNDTYGHLVGDQVICHIATLLQQSLRASDVPGRFGGEEFVALLSETNPRAAHLLAERLRATIAATPLIMEQGNVEQIAVTISIGIAGFDRLPPDVTLTTLIKNADDALYEAKRTGRNRVVDAGASTPPELLTSPTVGSLAPLAD